jgi:trehalose-6-phosphate synthase
MPSDLVIVYHRQPYEEVEENGQIVRKENKSPNGIVPTLKSFFGKVGNGAWVAWKLAEDPANPGFERVIEIDDAYGTYSVSRLPLTAEQVRELLPHHLEGGVLADPPFLQGQVQLRPRRLADLPRGELGLRRGRRAEAARAPWSGCTTTTSGWCPAICASCAPTCDRLLPPHALPLRGHVQRAALAGGDRAQPAACDVVGFHIPRYAANFVSVARSLFDVDGRWSAKPAPLDFPPSTAWRCRAHQPRRLRHRGPRVQVGAFPVGVDVDYIDGSPARPRTAPPERRIRRRWATTQADPLGLPHRLHQGQHRAASAFERLLERRKDLRGRVRLMHVSVSANRNMTAYERCRTRSSRSPGRINGRFGTFDWQPVALIGRAIPFKDLIAYYQAADVAGSRRWPTG